MAVIVGAGLRGGCLWQRASRQQIFLSVTSAAVPATLQSRSGPEAPFKVGQTRGMGRLMKVAGRKAATADRKRQLFSKLGKQLEAAARACKGDLTNVRLSSVIQRAKAANAPKDLIDQAYKRGVEGKEGAIMETVIYEGTAHAASFVVEALTDNRKRTAPVLRKLFADHGGVLGTSGSVMWAFEKKGYLEVPIPPETNEEIALEAVIDAGAEDAEVKDQSIYVVCDPTELAVVRDNLSASSFPPSTFQLIYQPKDTTSVTAEVAEMLESLVEALEDSDDVSHVYHNWESAE